MLGTDRRDDFVTTDLLAAWTDPDTAMEAVGASLGRLGGPPAQARRMISAETPLRHELYDVLLGLVDDGSLEKRATADGRYAFRWRQDPAPLVQVARAAPAPVISRAPAPAPAAAPERAHEPGVGVPVPVGGETERRWPRVLAPTAPLLLPTVSCLLALLAFVLLDRAVAFAIAAVLAIVGIVGLVRRVPFAGLWTTGLIVAVLLLRLS